MAKKKFHISYGIIHIVLILLTAVCVIPLLLVVGISFTDEQSLMSNGYNLIPKVS